MTEPLGAGEERSDAKPDRTLHGLIAGARLMAPVAAADVVDGMAFGALAVAAGLGQLAPIVLSATAFSGSAQYAAVAVLRDHGAVSAALLAAAALNVRYLALAAAVTASTTGSRWRRAARCLTLTDASWAVTSAHPASNRGSVLVGAGLLELIAWTAGTALGVLLGHLVGNTGRLGLDAAFPALFLWLLRGRERVALFGGQLFTGRVPGGGFAVQATLPLNPAGDAR